MKNQKLSHNWSEFAIGKVFIHSSHPIKIRAHFQYKQEFLWNFSQLETIVVRNLHVQFCVDGKIK